MRSTIHSRAIFLATLASLAFRPGEVRGQGFGASYLEPLSCGDPSTRAEAMMSFAQGEWIAGWTLGRLELGGAMVTRSGQRYSARMHGGQASSPKSRQVVNGGGLSLGFEAPIARNFGERFLPLCLTITGRGFRYADNQDFTFRGMRVGVGITGRLSDYFGPLRVTAHLSAGVAQGVTVWEGAGIEWNGATGYEVSESRLKNFKPVPDLEAGVSVKAGPVLGFTAVEWGEAETWPEPIWRAGIGFNF